MVVDFSPDAISILQGIANYIDSLNTFGAGDRWLLKLETFLNRSLIYYSAIKECHNLTFAKLGLKCIQFNDWVVAFSIRDEGVFIETILHSSRLTD